MSSRIDQKLGDTYCIVDKRKTGNLNPSVVQTKN